MIRRSIDVYNLKSVSDFAGTYSGGGAGIAVAGDSGVAELTNQNGVKIKIKSKTRDSAQIGPGRDENRVG